MNFYNLQEAKNLFLNEISKAKREVRIDIPDSPIINKFLINLPKVIEKLKKKDKSLCQS